MLPLTEDQRDCLQEVSNVTMGQAGDALARYLGEFVTLTIPRISQIQASLLPNSLNSFTSSDAVQASSQPFQAANDARLHGRAAVVLSQQSVDELAAIKPEKGHQLLIADTSRNLAQACLDAFAEHWDIEFECAPPAMFAEQTVDSFCGSLTTDWEQLLLVEINYRLEGHPFNGDLLLLFPDRAATAMMERLDNLLNS